MYNLESEEKIENFIYNIRGKEVMLDSDLARLYNCKNGTKTINQAVSRHPERFPMDFYFQLTIEEYYKEVPRSTVFGIFHYLRYKFPGESTIVAHSRMYDKLMDEVNRKYILIDPESLK